MSKVAVVILAIFLLLMTASPLVTSVEPNHGLNTGTVTVMVNGDKFDNKTTVKLTKSGEADILATNLHLLSKKKLEATFDLKGKTTGNWDVVVVKPTKTNKVKTATLHGGFTIEAPNPVISSVSPAQAMVNTKVSLVVKGTYFKPGIKVMLHNNQMDIGTSNVVLVSGEMVSCDLNLKDAKLGQYDVKVVNANGTTGVLANGFSVIAPAPSATPIPTPTVQSTPQPTIAGKPEIRSISPDNGFNNGKLLATISGVNLKAVSAAKLVNGAVTIPGLNVKDYDSTKVECFFDLTNKPLGTYDIVVTTKNGEQAVLKNGFTIKAFVPLTLDLNKQLRAIFFDFDKAVIRPDQQETLKKDLALLKANSHLFILLGGHADERGSQAYNLDLSARRSQAIKNYLVANGINPAQIVIYSYGKEYPVAVGHNESAWSLNRRVDVLVWEEHPTKEQGVVKSLNE